MDEMGSDNSAKTTMSRSVVYSGLIVAGLAFSAYISRPFRWFSLHPLLMLLAFFAAASAGIEAKRRGGRINTLLHGYTMCAALVLALGGWYVIYQQKVMLGKPHNTSWHAFAGLLAIGGYAAGAAGGLTALHPDWGVARSNTSLRTIHKLSSRVFTIVAFLAIVSGWYKLDGVATTGMLCAALLAISWSLLTNKAKPSTYSDLPLVENSD